MNSYKESGWAGLLLQDLSANSLVSVAQHVVFFEGSDHSYNHSCPQGEGGQVLASAFRVGCEKTACRVK